VQETRLWDRRARKRARCAARSTDAALIATPDPTCLPARCWSRRRLVAEVERAIGPSCPTHAVPASSLALKLPSTMPRCSRPARRRRLFRGSSPRARRTPRPRAIGHGRRAAPGEGEQARLTASSSTTWRSPPPHSASLIALSDEGAIAASREDRVRGRWSRAMRRSERLSPAAA